MAIWRITISGVPFGKEEKRVVRRGGFIHSYLPDRSRGYIDQVGWLFREAYPGHQLIDGPVRLKIMAYYRVHDYDSKALKARKVSGGVFPVVKPDLSNVIKLIEDGLTGVCWVDDNRVVEIGAYKAYSYEPRVEVEVEDFD